MKLINKWLQEAFGFSKTEINGTWLLLVLIILLAIMPRIYINNKHQNASYSAEDRLKLENWAKQVEDQICIKEAEEPASKYSGFQFGRENLAEATNYKTKKPFDKNWTKYKSDDNKKSGSGDFHEKKEFGPKYTSENKLNLNNADTTQLQSIKGIGPVLSKRIVKYRSSLGGFHNENQLNEVYGLSPELLESLSEISFVTDSLVQLNINSDSLKYLASHPYINYKMAKSILNYRKVHGDYGQVSDLLKLKLMTDSLYQKLYPYISVSQQDL